MRAARADPAHRAYEAMAPVYDDFTASYQAASWTGKLAERAEEAGLRGHRLLDVGCGTGKSALPMVERGWEVAGCDLSPAMLEVARGRLGNSVSLDVADVRELPVFGEFDLVWAVNDTLNYVLSGGELRASLEGMRENLGGGGLLVFDLNTLLTFRSSFAAEETREAEGTRMAWSGKARTDMPPGSICEAVLQVDDEPPAIHRQRHFPEAEVLSVAEEAGLSCLGVWGEIEGELSQPLDEALHTKAVYVLKEAD